MIENKSKYTEKIIELYTSGKDNAFEVYLEIYQPGADENDLEFIKRCSEQDYDDGFYDGAIYQEIFDELNKK